MKSGDLRFMFLSSQQFFTAFMVTSIFFKAKCVSRSLEKKLVKRS